MVDLQGMTPAEVARQLGMEQVTVRAHLFKARARFRRACSSSMRDAQGVSIMNCTEAREAMLAAEPEELRGETETAWPRTSRCADCRRASAMIVGSDAARACDRSALVAHTATRITPGDWPRPLPIAAVAVFAVVKAGRSARRANRRASHSPLPVARTVSLEVGRGQQATVSKTADPKVTVIWLSSGEGK
jgi:hypothetical protein